MFNETTRAISLLCLWGFVSHAASADQKLPDEPYLFAYTNQLSVAPGESIDFHVSTSAEWFEIDIKRYGAEVQVLLRGE